MMQGKQLYVALSRNELPDFLVLEECRVCGGTTTTVECRWCGADLAELEELASKSDAEEYLRQAFDWKG